MPEIRSPAYRVEQTASLPMAMASDIWAIGITLYCLIYGRVPFYGETKHDLFKVITTSPLNFPDDVSVPDDLKYLLTKLLDKSPAKRITIRKAKMAKWTTSDMTPEEVKEWIHETDPRVAGKVIGATNEEIKNAFTKLLSKIYHKVRGIGGTMNRPAIHRAFLRRSR